MFTPVQPEKAVEIENAFREATNIGEFVDAATLATDEMYPGDIGYNAVVRKFSADLNELLVKTLSGRHFPLRSVPDVVMLIDEHAAFTGIISGLLARQQEEIVAATAGQESN